MQFSDLLVLLIEAGEIKIEYFYYKDDYIFSYLHTATFCAAYICSPDIIVMDCSKIYVMRSFF